MMTCDYANSITSFPLDTTAPISESLYDSVDEPIIMTPQWATRSIAPIFLPGGLIDEGTSSGSGSSTITTLSFRNTTYSLYSIQIVKSTHNKWIIPAASKALNTEDLIMTFNNASSTFASYIVIVLPIIRTGTAQPNYLQALSASSLQSGSQTLSNAQQGQYSLSSCLPANNALFAYYVTCLDGYSGHERPSNAYVFIAVQGLQVAQSLMVAMKESIGTTPILPFTSYFANQMSSVSNNDFKQYVLSTRVLLNSGEVKAVSNQFATRSTSAYQCVPLDPDKDISDDQIEVDLKSGKLLSDVLAQRAGLIADTAPVQTAEQAKSVKIFFETIMGLITAIILFTVILYFVYSKSAATAATAEATAAAPTTSFTDMPFVPYIAVGLVFLVAGMAIGNRMGI